MSTLPQPQINVFVETDKNGISWLFPRQEFNNSCGPACLRYVKSLVHNCEFAEGQAREQISQFELRRPVGNSETQNVFGKALGSATDKTSVKAVKKALKVVLAPQDPSNAHKTRGSGAWIGDPSWHGMGTRPELVVKALQCAPLPVGTARLADGDYLTHLTKTTADYPAIVAVMWTVEYKTGRATDEHKELARKATQGTGGHFVLCVGPTKNGAQFIILDPLRGLRYIDRDDVTATCILYDNGASIGKADVAMQKNPTPMKVDDQLVEYVARGRFSKCGLIVTYPPT